MKFKFTTIATFIQ